MRENGFVSCFIDMLLKRTCEMLVGGYEVQLAYTHVDYVTETSYLWCERYFVSSRKN